MFTEFYFLVMICAICQEKPQTRKFQVQKWKGTKSTSAMAVTAAASNLRKIIRLFEAAARTRSKEEKGATTTW